MASYVKFQDFVEALALGEHDCNADTFKVYLSNTTPDVAADADKSDLAEITNENGYTAPVDIQNAMSESAGTATVTAVDVLITATGGTVGPFRYVVCYNDDHPTDGLICYWDRGSAVTLQAGESLSIEFGAALFTLA
jgi:hypothetical protein